MTEITPESVKGFLLKKYEAALRDHGFTPDQVPDNFDLFTEGIIDSLGVLTMISDVENHFNADLDMEHLDAEQLSVLGAFCQYTARYGKPRAGQANGSPVVNGNGLDVESVSADLRNFIRQKYSVGEDDREFTDTVHLYDAGYVDTNAAVNLRGFMESKFGIKMEGAEQPNLPTIRELASFVVKRHKGEA